MKERERRHILASVLNFMTTTTIIISTFTKQQILRLLNPLLETIVLGNVERIVEIDLLASGMNCFILSPLSTYQYFQWLPLITEKEQLVHKLEIAS